MTIFNKILNRILSYVRQVGLMSTLSFDQQVWGAKSVIDLVQHGSKFLLANSVNGGDCYTCWLGARDNRPTAIVISNTGHATGPFPDDSRVKACQPWTYPPAINCNQAVEILTKSGITEVWSDCTLKQTASQKNPAYTFTFAQHTPVTVDAATGKII